jgi:hypothetical protein
MAKPAAEAADMDPLLSLVCSDSPLLPLGPAPLAPLPCAPVTMLQEFLALCHGLPDTDCAALLCEVRGVSSRQQLSHADLTLEEVVTALSLVSHRMHPGTGGFDAPRLAATPPPSDFPFSCMCGPWYTADMLAGDSLCSVHAYSCKNLVILALAAQMRRSPSTL